MEDNRLDVISVLLESDVEGNKQSSGSTFVAIFVHRKFWFRALYRWLLILAEIESPIVLFIFILC